MVGKKQFAQRVTRLRWAAVAALAAGFSQGAMAQAGDPLPRCEPNTNAFHLLRYMEPTSSTAPFISTFGLGRVNLGADSDAIAPAETPFWTALNPTTVAAGIRPQDGYIYGLRAAAADSYDYPGSYRNDHRTFEILKLGTTGVTSLGQLVDGPGVAPGTAAGFDLQGLSNFNAADVDPATGHLIAGNVRSGGYINGTRQLERLLRIDVTTTPPQLAGVITLVAPGIPPGATGDFAIDLTGTYAYGMARTSSTLSQWWRANLSTGVVEVVQTFTTGLPSFGAIALLADGNFALFDNAGTVRTISASGSILSTATIAATDSSDAARCLPPIPPPAAVPATGSWNLLLLALGLAGSALVWRRKTSRF